MKTSHNERRALLNALSPAARSAWAKYDEKRNDAWLPLHRHMTDSAEVATRLWDHWLPEHSKNLIAQEAGGDAAARTLVSWLAGAHDIGKLSPAFAGQIELLTARMSANELTFPRLGVDTVRIPHSVISYIFLQRWMQQTLRADAQVAASYAVVPGGHHGVPPTNLDLRNARQRPGRLGSGPRWEAVQKELLDYIASYTGALEHLPRWKDRALPPTLQVLITAIVIVSDWIASADEYFGYGDPLAGLVDDRPSSERADDAWRRLDLPPAWRAKPAEGSAERLFEHRFSLPPGASLRPMQRAAIEVVSELDGPALLIIEAPMGEGKTEAALAACEILAASTGAGGVMLALPTMATSDAMFGRVLEWLERVPDARGAGELQSLFLAHSKAALNDDFASLHSVASVDVDYQRRTNPDELPEAVVVAHQWLFGRKKGVLSNFVVGTIDQILFGSLKSKHLVLRHLALANKVVVIDEAHAVDTYMSEYLNRVLVWLGAYRVPVILLSATLPPDARRSLAAAYSSFARRPLFDDDPWASTQREPGGLTAFDDLAAQTGYPLISAVKPEGDISSLSVESSGRSLTVTIERLDDDDESLEAMLRVALADGGCAGIIRNTVARAQHTAEFLRARFPGFEILLAHSRFIAYDRMQRDVLLRERLGPPREGEPATGRDRVIVVGTQVLEQSLDIDFDLLVSDLAPIDLLLQRLGRMHRHVRSSRPAPVSQPRFVVTGVIDWSASPPRPVEHSELIYGPYLLLRTLAVLDERWSRGRATVELPGEIAPLVRSTYDEGSVFAPEWREPVEAAARQWTKGNNDKSAKAQTFLLGDVPPSDENLVGWLAAGAGDAGEDSPDGQSQVRDTEDSIEVLVAQFVDDEVRVLPGVTQLGGSRVPTDDRPANALAKALAMSSIRLPPSLCRWWAIEKTIGALEVNAFAGWQQSPLLKGQLILLLDENLTATIDGKLVRYDRENGMTIDTNTPTEA